MRLTPVAAASALVLGVLLGGFTTSADTDAPQTVQQHTVAFAASTNVAVLETADNNGNG